MLAIIGNPTNNAVINPSTAPTTRPINIGPIDPKKSKNLPKPLAARRMTDFSCGPFFFKIDPFRRVAFVAYVKTNQPKQKAILWPVLIVNSSFEFSGANIQADRSISHFGLRTDLRAIYQIVSIQNKKGGPKSPPFIITDP